MNALGLAKSTVNFVEPPYLVAVKQAERLDKRETLVLLERLLDWQHQASLETVSSTTSEPDVVRTLIENHTTNKHIRKGLLAREDLTWEQTEKLVDACSEAELLVLTEAATNSQVLDVLTEKVCNWKMTRVGDTTRSTSKGEPARRPLGSRSSLAAGLLANKTLTNHSIIALLSRDGSREELNENLCLVLDEPQEDNLITKLAQAYPWPEDFLGRFVQSTKLDTIATEALVVLLNRMSGEHGVAKWLADETNEPVILDLIVQARHVEVTFELQQAGRPYIDELTKIIKIPNSKNPTYETLLHTLVSWLNTVNENDERLSSKAVAEELASSKDRARIEDLVRLVETSRCEEKLIVDAGITNPLLDDDQKLRLLVWSWETCKNLIEASWDVKEIVVLASMHTWQMSRLHFLIPLEDLIREFKRQDKLDGLVSAGFFGHPSLNQTSLRMLNTAWLNNAGGRALKLLDDMLGGSSQNWKLFEVLSKTGGRTVGETVDAVYFILGLKI